MRKFLLAGTALALLAAAPAFAQDTPKTPQTDQSSAASPSGKASSEKSTTAGGLATGAATGAVAGALVGGPVGAVIGGFAGAAIGGAAAVPEPAVKYVVAHPASQVTLEGPVEEGTVIPSSASLQPIPDYPDYSYVYVDGRPVIVKAQSRQVVYSPGYVVPDQTVTYVEQNPVDAVTIDGDLAPGTVIPQDVQIVQVPDDPAYGYVYTSNGPVLVNQSSRTVVWVK